MATGAGIRVEARKGRGQIGDVVAFVGVASMGAWSPGVWRQLMDRGRGGGNWGLGRRKGGVAPIGVGVVN